MSNEKAYSLLRKGSLSQIPHSSLSHFSWQRSVDSRSVLSTASPCSLVVPPPGLQLPGVETVINMELPELIDTCAELNIEFVADTEFKEAIFIYMKGSGRFKPAFPVCPDGGCIV